MIIIGTILNESLLSLVSTLKFDGVNPAPDMTKRMTALTLITKGSRPPVR
jgi:hypothetical protein